MYLRKHLFLQSKTEKINQEIINRSVNLARNQKIICDKCDINPPHLRLSSEQNIDVTGISLAFGRWALPKLRRELHDPNSAVVLQAVTTIYDLAHDPERGYEAIELKIPDRMADLLVHKDSAICERVCMALTVIANLANGKAAITKNKTCLDNIKKLMNDTLEIIRFKVAELLETLSHNWIDADDLVNAGFISLMLKKVTKEGVLITALYLEALKSMMYGKGKDEAFDLGAFQIFVSLMESRNVRITSLSAYCLMMITSIHKGKEKAYNKEILQRLVVLLNSNDKDVYTSAASAIMFCTIKSNSKLRARDMSHLIGRLVILSNDWHNPSAQIFSMKALTNICEHPEIRKEVKEEYLEKLQSIITMNDENLKIYKKTLLDIVLWTPWTK